MDRGYVRLWRKLEESEVFLNDALLKIWVWILMRVSFEPRKVPLETGKGTIIVTLSPGQMIFGRHRAAEALGWAESSVRNRVEKLKELRMINIQVDNQYSIITVVNHDIYNPNGNNEGQAKDRQRTGKGHIQALEAFKALKTKKTKPSAFALPDSIRPDVWSAFEEMRTKTKKPLTDRARNNIVAELGRLGGDPNALLDQSITNCWRGVFPLKQHTIPDPPKKERLCLCGKKPVMTVSNQPYCRECADKEAI